LISQEAAANEPPQTSEQASSNRSKPAHESFSVNPDTGIPSPRSTSHNGHPVEPAPPPTSSGIANPVMVVREVGPSAIGVGLSPGNVRQERKYDPSSYQGMRSLLCAFKTSEAFNAIVNEYMSRKRGKFEMCTKNNRGTKVMCHNRFEFTKVGFLNPAV